MRYTCSESPRKLQNIRSVAPFLTFLAADGSWVIASMHCRRILGHLIRKRNANHPSPARIFSHQGRKLKWVEGRCRVHLLYQFECGWSAIYEKREGLFLGVKLKEALCVHHLCTFSSAALEPQEKIEQKMRSETCILTSAMFHSHQTWILQTQPLQ